MFRTHTCGELRISDVNKQITLSGWVQRSRKMGGMTFIDLRDRYGITQLVFNEEINAELCDRANKLGREFVIQITGTVNERFSKNANIPTGDIEIIVSELNVLNTAMTPPFTIEDNTDGGDDIRMKYRYLDLRRNAVRSNLELRHKMRWWCYGPDMHFQRITRLHGGTCMPLRTLLIHSVPVRRWMIKVVRSLLPAGLVRVRMCLA